VKLPSGGLGHRLSMSGCSHLRSFFRFLFLSGQVLRDLAPSVPRVCKYRQAAPPAFLSPEEIERVLMATARSTPTGRRDYAILFLLTRLGLRAGEIVSLDLTTFAGGPARSWSALKAGSLTSCPCCPILAKPRLHSPGSQRQSIATALLTNMGAPRRAHRPGVRRSHCAAGARQVNQSSSPQLGRGRVHYEVA